MTSGSFNYYEVLDVTSDATQEQIYQAYRNARDTYSLTNPEIYKIFSEREALDWINTIEEAYSVIGHPNTRREYDNEIENAKVSSGNTASQQTEPQRAPLPEGYAETKYSQYPVNQSFEAEIKKQDLFDGIFLKKVREYKKIDLPDFSKITCIAIRHLYAIENNNFSVLPAPVFVRGYIQQYCRVLQLKEASVVPSFMSLLNND